MRQKMANAEGKLGAREIFDALYDMAERLKQGHDVMTEAGRRPESAAPLGPEWMAFRVMRREGAKDCLYGLDVLVRRAGVALPKMVTWDERGSQESIRRISVGGRGEVEIPAGYELLVRDSPDFSDPTRRLGGNAPAVHQKTAYGIADSGMTNFRTMASKLETLGLQESEAAAITYEIVKRLVEKQGS